MNKVEQFLQKHGLKVVIFLLVLTYMKSCGVDREVTKVKKQLIALDSLATKKDLEIEGLKAEKRMIQATDRKMLDVQRQSDIDAELKKLGAK
jgi:uncharacterized protein YcfL